MNTDLLAEDGQYQRLVGRRGARDVKAVHQLDDRRQLPVVTRHLVEGAQVLLDAQHPLRLPPGLCDRRLVESVAGYTQFETRCIYRSRGADPQQRQLFVDFQQPAERTILEPIGAVTALEIRQVSGREAEAVGGLWG